MSIYLGPIYAYEEKLEPVQFDPYPEKLPFPIRKATILPVNKTLDFTTEARDKNKPVEFAYSGDVTRLTYTVGLVENFPFSISITNGTKLNLLNDAKFQFDEKETQWSIDENKLERDTLFIRASAIVGGDSLPFRFYYTIQQKTLAMGMDEMGEIGHVKKIDIRNISKVKEGKLIRIPFLNFDYAKVPSIFYTDGLFYFMQFDWYYTDASKFYMNYLEITDGKAIHNGGVLNTPKPMASRIRFTNACLSMLLRMSMKFSQRLITPNYICDLLKPIDCDV